MKAQNFERDIMRITSNSQTQQHAFSGNATAIRISQLFPVSSTKQDPSTSVDTADGLELVQSHFVAAGRLAGGVLRLGAHA